MIFDNETQDFLEQLNKIRKRFSDNDGSSWTPKQLREHIVSLDDDMRQQLLHHFITLEWLRQNPIVLKEEKK